LVAYPLPESLAAVDLGSNSFHMVVARVVNGEPVIVDRLREQVRLAGGLDELNELLPPTRRRALECLHRFGERIRDLSPDGVRAVATNTLRVAANRREFLDAAESALGHPIEIVSGREEARLIYLGVSHSVADIPGARLVVDIGGGSTECILGERFEPHYVDSLEMGCVSFSRLFFPDGGIDRDRYREAVLAARLEVRPVANRFGKHTWTSVVGASGTVRAIAEIVRQSGWSPHGITAEALRSLERALLEAGHANELALPGLKAERRSVLAGGVAILSAIFEGLGVERMAASSGALREGVLFDLLGRLQHEDTRDRTIRAFQDRYHVDLDQAARVERCAIRLLEQVAADWELPEEEATRYLSWASRLHEIGLVLSFEGHHRHAAYIVSNADMPGFSRNDQELLATLLSRHRRKIRRSDFRHLPKRTRNRVMRLAVLERLAVRLNRGRSAEPPQPVELRVTKSKIHKIHKIHLGLPQGWLDANPLTRTDLAAEAQRLRGLGMRLKVYEIEPPSRLGREATTEVVP